MMMTNKEKYKQAFSVLHASNNISLEVNDMDKKKSLKPKRNLVAACMSAVAIIAAGMTVYAATNGEIFSRIWGTLGKNNVESHDEVVYDEEKKTSYTVTYPKREYEDIDVEKAEELIGGQITYEDITLDIDGTTLTILSAVRDNNAAVVEFSLSKAGGVDALMYSQFDNETKGAEFSNDATFWFRIGDSGENIYVDLEKSTGDILYCYDYLTMDSVKESIPMEVYVFPGTRGEYIAAQGNVEGEVERKYIEIPVSDIVSNIELVNEAGGVVEISPISMKVDLAVGLDLSYEVAQDPYSCYKTVIYYKDGSSYIVQEHSNSRHSCDVEIDNRAYSCGSLGTEVTYVFNRLVDVDKIDYISINDVEYSIK